MNESEKNEVCNEISTEICTTLIKKSMLKTASKKDMFAMAINAIATAYEVTSYNLLIESNSDSVRGIANILTDIHSRTMSSLKKNMARIVNQVERGVPAMDAVQGVLGPCTLLKATKKRKEK